MIEDCIAPDVCSHLSQTLSVVQRTPYHFREVLMFAQVYSYQSDPSQLEADLQFVKKFVLPDLQSMRGFKGGRMLVDRQTGRALGISYWENQADARAAAERVASPPPPAP